MKLAVALLVAACGSAAAQPQPPLSPTAPAPPTAPTAFTPLADPDLQLIATPAADHAPFVQAIDAAATSIDLAMFHLTDKQVVDALQRAATRGVAVRVIIDHDSVKAKANQRAYDSLRTRGVPIRRSSKQFSITHEKAMVVDGKIAFVTAINLTNDVDKTRDLGVITRAPDVVSDVAALFEADWTNADGQGHVTPAQRAASLVVSPTSSRGKLVALLGSAQKTVDLTVENLGDPAIVDAIVAAAKRGATVRAIVPACDKNPDELYNLPAAQQLATAGVAVRMMPAPEAADTPYMHSKMILVDGHVAYIGSVNFSGNSLAHARELGVIVDSAVAGGQIRATFEADFGHAVAPPTARPASCRAIGH